MKRKLTIFTLIIIILGLFTWVFYYAFFINKAISEVKVKDEVIEKFMSDRQAEEMKDDDNVDPFGEDGIARVLLIGLDKRVGENKGHCDAIQLITINKEEESVTITAVPRGTYSSLPPGKAATSTDYYVSNSCALGGLEYGVEQIEKILGEKADYLVVVGFSETLGILRNLKLPTTTTLQWLRQRHIYAIGEPQRAHDHSTFLKYLLTKYVPKKYSNIDKIFHYLIYKIVQTDLSFSETEELIKALVSINLSDNPEKIKLIMKPNDYNVKEIDYNPENLDEYLESTSKIMNNILSSNNYSDTSLAETQIKLLEEIDLKKDDPEFIVWAINNNIWLQIEDKEKRLSVQFDFLEKYIKNSSDEEERENLISDYILEMEEIKEDGWAEKGKELFFKNFE